jgi:hypothetical protein
MTMKIFKMLIPEKQHIRVIGTHNQQNASFETMKTHSCAKIPGVFPQYGFVMGSEKKCLVES